MRIEKHQRAFLVYYHFSIYLKKCETFVSPFLLFYLFFALVDLELREEKVVGLDFFAWAWYNKWEI